MASKRSRQAFEDDLQKRDSPYVFYGAPLPPLDEHVRDDGSFVPVWKQEVTDDRGRKRLHGAFTGGFSAGYYNSVGSKEGWTPAAFVSSRQNRMKDSKTAREQKAEDFMDDEDMREAEESRHLATANSFAGFGTEADERRRGAIMDIFRPPDDSVGVKLLNRMGWKEGQGIGPKVKRIADLGDGAASSGAAHSYAPPDVATISFNRKTDRKGLGYDEESSSNIEISPAKPTGVQEDETDYSNEDFGGSTAKTNTRIPRRGFGVGVMNDTGSDDEDPYSMGPKISYNKVIGGDKKTKKRPLNNIGSANPTLKAKPVFVSKKLSTLQSTLRKCHDGRLPPDGFVLGDELDSFASMSLSNDKYRPPEVPEGWKSALAPGAAPSLSSEFVSVADAARSSTQSAKSRASILGEAQLPGKSVFDYLSVATRDHLAAASGKSNLPQAMGERPPPGFEPSQQQTQAALRELVPKLDQDVALQALRRGVGGWMPYAEDEAKRERYRTYLEIRAGLRSTGEGDEIPPRPANMSKDDWVIEMQEFARAAEVFRPITGFMASRFTSSSTSVPQSSSGNAADALLSTAAPKPEDPAEVAATMGMFGPMTRSVVNFFPTRLVCKRFNIPMPDHGSQDVESSVSHSTARSETRASQGMELSANALSYEAASLVGAAVAGAGNDTTKAINLNESHVAIDADRNDALEQEKPGQALFKAIFGSDDEDDEGGED